MRAELLLGLGARLVGDEAQVELGDRAAGQDRLPAGTGVTRDEAFDIDRRFLRETGQRILIRQIVDPVGDAERLLLRRFVAPLCGLPDQRLFALRYRADIFVPAPDSGPVAIAGAEDMWRLPQTPPGRMSPRFL